MLNTHTTGRATRRSRLVAGIALVIMMALAGYANFRAIDPLVAPGDAATTASNIAGAPGQLRLGIALMAIVAVLDIVVARALNTVFADVDKRAAVVAGRFRIAYAVGFLAALSWLVTAPSLTNRPLLAAHAVESYHAAWQIALIVFGIHLVLVARLAWKAGIWRRVLAPLLAIAGLGYIADGVATVLDPGYSPTFAKYTFVGEVALMVWLLITGLRSSRSAGLAPQTADAPVTTDLTISMH